MKNDIVVGTEEIKEIFKEYCSDTDTKFSEKEFREFLDFLQVDTYDWTMGNLRYYFTQHKNQN